MGLWVSGGYSGVGGFCGAQRGSEQCFPGYKCEYLSALQQYSFVSVYNGGGDFGRYFDLYFPEKMGAEKAGTGGRAAEEDRPGHGDSDSTLSDVFAPDVKEYIDTL